MVLIILCNWNFNGQKTGKSQIKEIKGEQAGAQEWITINGNTYFSMDGTVYNLQLPVFSTQYGML